MKKLLRDTLHKINVQTTALILLFSLVPLFPISDYWIHILILVYLYAINATGWGITYKCGALNLGAALFMGIGAYATGFLSVSRFGLGFHPLVAILMACIAATLFGLVVGVPSIRTKGIYLAIVTLVMAETVMLIMLKGGRTTGGDEGLLQIPSLFSNVRSYYYLAFLTLIVLSVVFEKIMMSKYGIAFRAIAGDELAARSLGVEANKYRLLAFVLSAGFGGISGAIFAHYTGTITPDIFSIATLNLVLSMAIIGGAGTAMGSIIGSFLIVFLEEFFRFTVDYRFVIINIIMIACILYVPKGIWGLIKWKLFRKLRA